MLGAEAPQHVFSKRRASASSHTSTATRTRAARCRCSAAPGQKDWMRSPVEVNLYGSPTTDTLGARNSRDNGL